MNLYLIRHPKPDVVSGTCYGSMDLALQAGWQQDAEQLSNWLFPRLTGKTKAYHSPLKRAAQLAQFLIPDSIVADPLSELDFGHWEGLLWDEIPREELDLWANNLMLENPYNGESMSQFSERLLTWWKGLQLTSKQIDNLILVTHSGVIKVLVSHLCNWPLQQSHSIAPDFLSITELSLYSTESNQLNSGRLIRLGAGDWL